MIRLLKNRRNLNLIVLIILVAVAFFGITESVRMNPTGIDGAWWSGLWQNFSTEVMGAIMTFVLFEVIVNGQQRASDSEAQRKSNQLQAVSEFYRASTQEERQPIINRMKSGNLFKEANLENANLEGAVLAGANLEGADLTGANLTGTALETANLEGADLTGANLEGANLVSVSLEGANLIGAKLIGANLMAANLEGANLKFVNLDNVIWANDDSQYFATLPDDSQYPAATLPDGTKWAPETDMTRFTDPNHPDFWSPED